MRGGLCSKPSAHATFHSSRPQDRMGGARGPTLNSFQLCTKGSLRKCDCSGVFQPIGGAVGLWEPLFAAVGGAVWASPSPAQLNKGEGTERSLSKKGPGNNLNDHHDGPC